MISINELTSSQTQACIPRFWLLNWSGFKKYHTKSELLAAAKKQFFRKCMFQKLGWELQGFILCFQIKSCQDKGFTSLIGFKMVIPNFPLKKSQFNMNSQRHKSSVNMKQFILIYPPGFLLPNFPLLHSSCIFLLMFIASKPYHSSQPCISVFFQNIETFPNLFISCSQTPPRQLQLIYYSECKDV